MHDQHGRPVASDTDFTDECLVIFTPNRTQRFRVELENLGSVYNCYAIETN